MSEQFYTPAKCEEIRFAIRMYGMSAPAQLFNASADDLAGVFNGCGPDAWPQTMRSKLTWVYRNFPEMIAVHDWRFMFSDGNLDTLRKVNDEFLANGKIKLNALYPLSKPWLYVHRAIAWTKITIAYNALLAGSDESWISAYQRYGGEHCGTCIYNINGQCYPRQRPIADFGWCLKYAKESACDTAPNLRQ